MLLTSPDTLHDSKRWYYPCKVFLAGSIENGSATNWQESFYELVLNKLRLASFRKMSDVLFFNPRRKEWNPNADNSELKTQILWELNYLDSSKIVFFYFAKGTISPISLLELGLMIPQDDVELVVVCEDDYFRSTNVNQTLEFFKGQNILSTLDEGANVLAGKIMKSFKKE